MGRSAGAWPTVSSESSQNDLEEVSRQEPGEESHGFQAEGEEAPSCESS